MGTDPSLQIGFVEQGRSIVDSGVWHVMRIRQLTEAFWAHADFHGSLLYREQAR